MRLHGCFTIVWMPTANGKLHSRVLHEGVLDGDIHMHGQKSGRQHLDATGQQERDFDGTSYLAVTPVVMQEILA
jgi:hypothetical protein